MSSSSNRGRGKPAKPTPNEVIDEGLDRINGRFHIWLATDSMLEDRQAMRHSRVVHAEEALHTFAVTVEDTISRWCLAAVRSNGKPALQNIKRQIHDAAQKAAVQRFQEFKLPSEYRLDVSVEVYPPAETGLRANDAHSVLLNSMGDNITFQGKSEWDRWCGVNLPEPYKRIAHSLPEKEWGVLSYVRCLRNHIAHKSRRSLRALNSEISGIRKDKASFGDICRSSRQSIKFQTGGEVGDLLLAAAAAGEESVLKGIYFRINGIFVSLKKS